MQWDESGATLTSGFPYAAVEESLGEMTTDLNRETAIELACEESRRIFMWVYQPPCEDLDGFLCRTIIACWIFVPELRTYSMTYMAERFGKDKQSLGRWAVDFKRTFPELKNIEHFKND